MQRTTMARNIRWFRGRVVCALDYEAGDPGSIPSSGGTTCWPRFDNRGFAGNNLFHPYQVEIS